MDTMQAAAAYLAAICEGLMPPPPGLDPGDGTPEDRAKALQGQIAALGVEEFVRRCQAQEAAQPQEPQTPQIQEPDGPRSAAEALLDCCLLDDGLFRYLLQLLKTGDEHGFEQLALVCCRRAFEAPALLDWLMTLEQRGSESQRQCAAVLDRALERVRRSGQLELLAALLSGDRATYDAFHALDPELKALPQADYDWYETHYLTQYYPVRFMLRFHGVLPPVQEARP